MDLDRPRDAALGGRAVAVAEALRHVADPRGGDPAHAARADQLVEQGVRDGTDELEFATLLSDQLVSRGEGNEWLEAGTDRDRRTVRYEPIDGLGHRHQFAQRLSVSIYER